ncbi:cyclopropane-fatty-acyl-phospholipid synthase [Aspergillus saccharolyticus JOP 1030-1]|uniref:Cyclopropane-fatty-acyl-phospholipid synthase n=1 Tax=Aspergillus saccharolyticus JOP 1030-1 TaxID=1450539 RepID=A0A318ZA25_9EURO|nr:cyclopropane-fatty-acyl-phospholipid synthase [Aspergillus saccharolyticus JOP 1030-1]PYH43184.1 cyclopropane-fatty-acyl-phospholipid synthase [Aspergillus saccharolyticus JOP 1030-1]
MDVGRVLGSTGKQLLDRIQTTAISLGMAAVPVSLLRSLVFSILSNVKTGVLDIHSHDGQEWRFGSGNGGPNGMIHLHSDAFWFRVFVSADLGFADSYMLGEFTTPNLMGLIKLFIVNEQHLSNLSTTPYRFVSTVSDMLFSTVDTGTLKRASLNMVAAYDLSNEMFEAFLSPDMSYSCPIWLPKSHPEYSSDTLEAAQMRKLDTLFANVHAQPTDHILEIGTGWGSLAIRAATTIGCRVTTCTLSEMQYKRARKRVEALGLQDKVTVLLSDYRLLPTPETPYDKIIAVEMMEAMGDYELETFWETVDRFLKPEGGICSVQASIMPESRYKNMFPKGEGFIRRYIFPGGHCPSVTRLLEAVQKSNARLDLDSIQQYGAHYVRCLNEWSRKFQDNFQSIIAPLMREKYHLSERDVEVFYRKYIYYFAYAAAAFDTKILHLAQITFSRSGSLALLEDV